MRWDLQANRMADKIDWIASKYYSVARGIVSCDALAAQVFKEASEICFGDDAIKWQRQFYSAAPSARRAISRSLAKSAELAGALAASALQNEPRTHRHALLIFANRACMM